MSFKVSLTGLSSVSCSFCVRPWPNPAAAFSMTPSPLLLPALHSEEAALEGWPLHH